MCRKYIGDPALLKLCAEECTELAQACLKYARKLRGENPTNMSIDEIIKNTNEEIGDVEICIEELKKQYLVSTIDIDKSKKYKNNRWNERMKGEDK